MSLRQSLPFPDVRRRLRGSFSASDTPALVVLVALTVVIVVSGFLWPVYVPTNTLVLPMIIGSLWLGPRSLPWFTVFVCVGVSVMLFEPSVRVNERSVMRIVVIFVVALIILLTSFRRSQLGVSGPRGESMFVDLRDRISRQGVLPALPDQWSVEAVVRSAGGTQFAGDFVVARRSVDDRLDVVLVDVSGKGVAAGSRSLFLSGAFNGIVSALPGEEFLPAANSYLMGQDWDEGFATAIHLHLDLGTGDFELRKAGHPPAVWLHAGSGRWTVVASDGPILGLMAEAEFECVRGRLAAGDGLMLFTDGLVETSTRDIALGIDKLAGLGERMLQQGFEGAAERAVSAITHTNDDRALIVVHRRW